MVTGGGMPGMSAPLPPGRFAVQATGDFAKDKGKELAETAKALRWEAQSRQNSLREKDATELSNYAAVLEQMREMLVAQGMKKEGAAARTANEGPSVTYHLSAKLSVPSRTDEQVIEVTKLELEPEYFYKAVPVLTSHVYRQATLQNKSKHVLLPGEATMYHGTDFVGRMTLPLVAVGEKFTVGFGADTQLQVQRQMMDRSKTMQAGNQVLKYDYRILISSYKTEKVKVQVWDRLPIAEKESMTVNMVKSEPSVCTDPVYVREDRANNLLRWDVDVEPDMRGEKALRIQYEFQLELDRQATLGSFQNR